MSTGHGILPGGASAAGDPRPAAPLLHQPRCPTDAGAQELRHEEGRPGQVKLSRVQEQSLMVVGPWTHNVHGPKPKTILMSTPQDLFPSHLSLALFHKRFSNIHSD